MNLMNVEEHDLYPTERFGPKLLGTMLYKMGEVDMFETAYVTTNERIIMNANMHNELYQRVFSYQDVKEASYEADKESVILVFTNGMKIPMIDIKEGDATAFVNYINNQIQ